MSVASLSTTTTNKMFGQERKKRQDRSKILIWRVLLPVLILGCNVAYWILQVPSNNLSPKSGIRGNLPKENWRGAPVGDGEDTVNSYHSYDHRPTESNDPRDKLLLQYKAYPCPGIGTMVSGQDPRYYDAPPSKKKEYKERNPKFICDPHKLKQPCVVYSFGSWDETSFEIGIDKITNSKCQVHTFDPAKLPPASIADKFHFVTHNTGIAAKDDGKYKTLSTIMNELKHDHINIFKIDVEGFEKQALPNIQATGLFQKMDQVAIEFHSVELMKQGMDILVQEGFQMVFARREDRCQKCTEVTMVRM